MRPLNTPLHRWIGAGALALTLLPAAASAQEAYARNAVNLRAGPATNYPVVAVVGAGQNFEVLGCTQGYSWCDVVMPDGLRGWMFSEVIDYAYQQQRVPLANYGAAIGVPIIGFALGSYWGNNYRDRPFYDDRRWWGGRPPPPRDGWRPPPQPERPNWRPREWDGQRAGQRGDASPRPGYQPPNAMRPSPPEDRRNDPRWRPDREFGGGRPPGMRPEDSRSFDGGRQPDGRGRPLQGEPQRQVQSPRPQAPAMTTPPQVVAPQAAPAPAQPMRQRGGPPSGGAAGSGREGGREGGPGGRGGGEGGGGPGGRGGGGGGGGPGNSGRPG